MTTARRNVLVVGPSWIGDMVMAQSLFQILRQQISGVQISVLAPSWSLPLLSRMPEVAVAIPTPFEHGRLSLRQRFQLAYQLRAKHLDQAIILPRSFKAALVPFLAGIPLRTGFLGEQRYGLLNDIRDNEGYVMEGTGENIFIIRNGTIFTPDLTSALEGITRDTVVSLIAELDLELIEKRITRDEVYVADEAFFTGTAAEVTPIAELDGRKIGSGARGPITKQLQSRFFDCVYGRHSQHMNWLTYV